jgi:hypothetical protein
MLGACTKSCTENFILLPVSQYNTKLKTNILSSLKFNFLNSYSKILQQQTVAQVVNKSPAFYKTSLPLPEKHVL